MISLISFIVLMIGGLNWFCIGALQYDFVAGLFGSQANIFSRLVYVLVGISSILVGYYAIKNKGKVVNFKKVKAMMPFKKKEEKEESNYSIHEEPRFSTQHNYHDDVMNNYHDEEHHTHTYHARRQKNQDHQDFDHE